MNPAYRGSRGFTLLEALIVLFLISVSTAISYPGAKSWLIRFQESSELRSIIAAFQQARAEAARRNGNVVLAFTDGTADAPGQRGSYRMFAAPRTADPIALSEARDFDALLLRTNRDHLGFNFQGLPANGTTGTMTLLGHRGVEYKITMSRCGRVALKRTQQ